MPDADNQAPQVAPTQPESVKQHSARPDVSQGANSNLSSADVSSEGKDAARDIEQAHQRSGQKD